VRTVLSQSPDIASTLSRVCPYLLDRPAKSIPQPLSLLQSQEATEAGTWKLVQDIAERADQRLFQDKHRLRDSFDRRWKDLEGRLDRIKLVRSDEPVDEAVLTSSQATDDFSAQKETMQNLSAQLQELQDSVHALTAPTSSGYGSMGSQTTRGSALRARGFLDWMERAYGGVASVAGPRIVQHPLSNYLAESRAFVTYEGEAPPYRKAELENALRDAFNADSMVGHVDVSVRWLFDRTAWQVIDAVASSSIGPRPQLSDWGQPVIEHLRAAKIPIVDE
jgi:hypothetical protein